MRKTNLIGQRFNHWVVLEEVPYFTKSGNKKYYVKCRCDCGKICVICKGSLTRSRNISTQCKSCSAKACQLRKRNTILALGAKYPYYGEKGNLKKHLELNNKVIGKKFNNITILKFDHWEDFIDRGKKRKMPYYKARCVCGKIFFISRDNIRRKKSCGCLTKSYCRRGENHPKALFNSEQVKLMRQLNKSGMGYSIQEIAKMFHSEYSTIKNILKNQRYVDATF